MTETDHKKPYVIQLKSAGAQEQRPALMAELRFAPETPAVGAPGKTPGEILFSQRSEGEATVIVSLGKEGSCTAETARRAGGGLGRWLVSSGATEIGVHLDTLQDCAENSPEALLEGIRLGAYHFNRYKKSNDAANHGGAMTGGAEKSTITVTVFGGQSSQALIDRVNAVTDAVILARDLSHEPANVINPQTLADRARAVSEQAGLKITVLDDQQLKQMGAGTILAVGQGSRTPPRMIILEYAGEGTAAGEKPVALVGKAITFDTGGYSIKSTEGIVGMKYDKCGGVDVLAIMQAAAALKLRTSIVGVIAAAENMISGESYRPDDIITSLNGKTVEIVSTDAEGRLVLADALTYVQREYQPRAIIDLATLTGGVVVALGRVRAGLLSNSDTLANALFQAGEETGERLWRLPLDEEYSKNMQGEDADLKNSGGREGHAILGGAFLKEFIEDDTPWAHLDIAGVADINKDMPYSPKGATGFGVRLLINYLQSL